MKPCTKAIYALMLSRCAEGKSVTSNELHRRFMTPDYRSRISEIRTHLRETGTLLRVESKRIPGQRTNEYRLVGLEV